MPRTAAQLRIGDICRYNHEQHELVALDGLIAQLRRFDGQLSAIKLSDLFCDKPFEVINPVVRRRQLPPPGFGVPRRKLKSGRDGLNITSPRYLMAHPWNQPRAWPLAPSTTQQVPPSDSGSGRKQLNPKPAAPHCSSG